MKQIKKIKAYAVLLENDDFIPDFNIGNEMKNVMQIHSDRKSAQKVVDRIGDDWRVERIEINFTHPNSNTLDYNIKNFKSQNK